MNEHKRRQQQLQTLLKIKEADKQLALKQLLDVRSQFQQLKKQLDKMIDYRQEYHSQIEAIGEQGCNINKMRNRISFIGQLDEGIKQINQKLAMIAKRRSHCEMILIEKQKKVQAVEKLIESGKKTAILAENKLEQKENDEYASKRWYNDK